MLFKLKQMKEQTEWVQIQEKEYNEQFRLHVRLAKINSRSGNSSPISIDDITLI